MPTEDVTIIGAGPAGIATAIQIERYGIKPLLLEKRHIGGMLVNANLVENYPGFPDGISGVSLVRLFEEQLKRAGATVNFEEVLHLDYATGFVIETSKRRVNSRVVVIASGTKPKELDLPSEVMNRVFSEVYPIADVEGKRMVIIGAGDAAFDYALNLSRKNEITILNRGRERKCLPMLWDRAKASSRITYIEDASVSAISDQREKLVLKCRKPQKECELVADYAIFAIGRKAQLDFLSERLKGLAAGLEEKGLLYFVGDVGNEICRQTSIAVGDGVHAAMKIFRMMQEAYL